MKIAHVINSLGKGGAEKLLSELLPLLHQKHEITLVVLTSNDNIYGEFIENENIKVCYLSQEIQLKKWSIFAKLKKYFKQNQFDLVHVHLFPCQYFVPFVTKAPLIFTEHSTTSKRRKKILVPLEKFIYHKYRSYVFVSEQAKKSFADFIGSENTSKNRVVFNGISLNKVANEIEFTYSGPIIMMISSFKAEKDHATLIRAIREIPQTQLILLGEGELMQPMKDLVNSLNLTDRVHFIGFHKNVLDYMNKADIIVQSSFQEGFGLSVLEAMSLGKPVLVSDIDGLKEVVDDRLYRFTPDELVGKLSNLIQDKQAYNQAIEYSLKQSKNFSIEKTVADYLAIYEEVK